ncbi:hypothetical protein [Streptomyces sp. ISL-86]|uniref:hypothetical protein n=1 Tax=Streptomyces sp. ISL-86 TaxID=2819187 RepID=UPI001BE5BD56|nr:hypothetical protein [Streptomyces sp. ISL-86]MBT2455525.1 hypothetical protein [Streptomyces sp. ISL-86]
MAVAETPTGSSGSSGSSTDHSRGRQPGRRAHHVPMAPMMKGPNGTQNTTGWNSSTHYSSEYPNIIDAPLTSPAPGLLPRLTPA